MKRRFKIIIYVFFVVVILSNIKVSAHSNKIDNYQINFKSITLKDGLSQATVTYIYQDSDGYMWFGTNNGLNKYDGIYFEVYRYQGENTNSISGDHIVSIVEDKYGYLWVGTSRGLNKINRKTGEIKNYLKDEKEGSLSSDNICEIFIDSKDRILISTVDGINIYNEDTDDFTRILYSEKEELLTSQEIYSIVESDNNIYWIATPNGLNKYDENINDVKKYTYNNESSLISGNEIYDLYIDKYDMLYVSTIDGGLTRINTKTEEADFFINDSSNLKSIPGNEVRGVLRDSKDNLWVATNNGLARFDENNNEFITYKSKIYDTNTIVNNDIYSLFESNLGTIWVGTFDGISLFSNESFFETYRNDPFDENTLISNILQGIYKDNNGYIWVGTNDSGVNIIDRNNNNIYRLDKENELNSLLTSTNITDINGFDNKVLIGTDNGINCINIDTGEIKKYLHNNPDSYESDIREIYIDRKGLIWIGTRNGLFTLDKNGNLENLNYLFERNNIEEKMISSIFEDCDGEIWIGLTISGGLLKYNKESGEIIRYKNEKNNENSLSYNEIRNINGDDEGNIWIATTYGLNKFNKNNNTFTRYSEEDGLANNFVYGVLLDNENNPWVSTNYGISKYDIKKDKFVNFTVNDGLQGNEFNGYSYYKGSNGEMFFGGMNGLSIFYPEDYEENNIYSEVIINKVLLNGNNINFHNEVDLKYWDKNIQISFFYPDYINASKVNYVYKMEGLDKEWTLSGNRNYISYNNLPSGKYKFLVSARNSCGEWSDVRSITINKRRAILNTPLAYVLYLAIIIIVTYLRWNRMKLLNKLVKKRTEELNYKLKENNDLFEKLLCYEKEKNNYFVNLSHELRTPLNVILSIEQLITSLNEKEENIEKSKIKHYMKVLRGNSKRLLKLINDIIDVSKIEAGQYKLDIKEYDIVYHVEELALSMKDFIESKGIELIIDPHMEERIIKCDIAEIEKCVVNILGNAVKFTASGGKIYVIISESNEFIKISIKDTGIGIDKKDIDEIFDRFKQAYNKKSEELGGSGIGLTLTKQIIELHGGKLLVESEVGVGSEFIMILPINQ